MLPDQPFDLSATLQSGQTFHWHAWEGGGLGSIGDDPVWVRQTAGGLEIIPQGMEEKVRGYFALDHDVVAMMRSFPAGDVPLATALAFCPGLRILRQPLWECLATFITSSLKQVPHIRKISLTLRERFGVELPTVMEGAPKLYGYPTPQALAEAGEGALWECGLGYRAAFLHRAAVDLAAGRVDAAMLAGQSDDEARATLMQLHGVGEKIANCVLLFACERLAAFPIDVWIERVLHQLYFARKRRRTAEQIRKFAARHFGPYAGYAQQFLFHHARLTKLRPGASDASRGPAGQLLRPAP